MNTLHRNGGTAVDFEQETENHHRCSDRSDIRILPVAVYTAHGGSVRESVPAPGRRTGA